MALSTEDCCVVYTRPSPSFLRRWLFSRAQHPYVWSPRPQKAHHMPHYHKGKGLSWLCVCKCVSGRLLASAIRAIASGAEDITQARLLASGADPVASAIPGVPNAPLIAAVDFTCSGAAFCTDRQVWSTVDAELHGSALDQRWRFQAALLEQVEFPQGALQTQSVAKIPMVRCGATARPCWQELKGGMEPVCGIIYSAIC